MNQQNDELDALFGDGDDPFGAAGGLGGDDGGIGPAPARTIQQFNEEVQRKIAVLSSVKSPEKARIEAALWLGESGEIDSIRPLVAVYKRDKKHPKVQRAAATALGMFKTLDRAIVRGPDDSIEDALDRAENADVTSVLTEIALFDRRGKRRGGGRWLRSIIFLSITFGLLMVAYNVLKPGSLREALTPPTATPTPTIDPNAPTATPTLTPSATPTITPTPTVTPGIPPTESRAIRADLLTLIDRSVVRRDFLDSLDTVWLTMSQNTTPTVISNLCNTPEPDIPEDYVLPPGYAELDPALRDATEFVNAGLALTRDGWRYFREGCGANDFAQRLQTGLSIVSTAKDSFTSARRILDATR
ncbi:MAG: hypothetical protein MUF38_04540 [Anaerolineae bacterium]|jgi:hypothetical protein|nr:hypothetical protein [Anaerolineae bacterium]